jgi:hypothetical protein
VQRAGYLPYLQLRLTDLADLKRIANQDQLVPKQTRQVAPELPKHPRQTRI